MFVFPLQTFDSVSWNTSCWRSSYDSDVSEEFTTFGQTLDEEVLQVCQSYLFPEEEQATPASCCSSTSSHRDRVRAEEEESGLRRKSCSFLKFSKWLLRQRRTQSLLCRPISWKRLLSLRLTSVSRRKRGGPLVECSGGGGSVEGGGRFIQLPSLKLRNPGRRSIVAFSSTSSQSTVCLHLHGQ